MTSSSVDSLRTLSLKMILFLSSGGAKVMIQMIMMTVRIMKKRGAEIIIS
jgi:hypothetical protein